MKVTHHVECGWKSNGKAFRQKQFSACIIRVGKVEWEGKRRRERTQGFVVVMQYNHSLINVALC
jgi:hypothetical protein